MARHTRRNDTERDNARREVARRYLAGQTQAEIARDLAVSQQQVSYDVQRVREGWRDQAVRDYDELVSESLARIDNLEREYWEAWGRSQGLYTRRRTDQARGVRRTTVWKERRVGNPAFLKGIEWCIAERSKLLGLYPSEGGAHLYEEPVEPYDPIGDATRARLLIARFMESQARDTDADTPPVQ